jgi:hypothetical protein
MAREMILNQSGVWSGRQVRPPSEWQGELTQLYFDVVELREERLFLRSVGRLGLTALVFGRHLFPRFLERRRARTAAPPS